MSEISPERTSLVKELYKAMERRVTYFRDGKDVRIHFNAAR
jgi:hypothetical protein